MKVSRRQVLQVAAAASCAIPLAGCEHVASELTRRLGESFPEKLKVAANPEIDPDFHLLSARHTVHDPEIWSS